MLRDVSARNIENSITTLASFGTRHTLSSQTDPNRGIGAATNWVFDQFTQYAAASNGRLTVEKQTFIQPPGPRNPEPVSVTNVIGTLHGSQPESANRIYLVSGHLDSRCTDVLDFTCDAPGADDDASGVAAVLELARVMAKHSFDATIVFAVFDGEEQGTFGSIHYAQTAKAAGMNIAGMFSNDIVGSSLA
jgi:Zn-dependent M28 family amino/carboxypeptidase